MSSDITVLGGAGELGSNFAKLCIERGHTVKLIDIVRFNEAWRLKWLGIEDEIEYVWKSSFDLVSDDIRNTGLVLDCACQPDRPLGNTSPMFTLYNNLIGSTRLLECVSKHTGETPIILYPSSCNVFLGVPPENQPLVESTKPMPINYYAWSKLAAEELYLTYNRIHRMNNIIIRTGSCYGEGMRTDQMIAKCIIHAIKGKPFTVMSPKAKRTYTYTGDVLEFYKKLLNKLDSEPEFLIPHGSVIHNGGNFEDMAYETKHIAEEICSLAVSDIELIDGNYEKGEKLPDGRPVQQHERSELAKELLGWSPETSISKGLDNTIEWFMSRIEDFI